MPRVFTAPGEAAFGGVQGWHGVQAGQCLELVGQELAQPGLEGDGIHHQAVDAQANTIAVGFRVEVDIRGAYGHGVLDQGMGLEPALRVFVLVEVFAQAGDKVGFQRASVTGRLAEGFRHSAPGRTTGLTVAGVRAARSRSA